VIGERLLISSYLLYLLLCYCDIVLLCYYAFESITVVFLSLFLPVSAMDVPPLTCYTFLLTTLLYALKGGRFFASLAASE